MPVIKLKKGCSIKDRTTFPRTKRDKELEETVQKAFNAIRIKDRITFPKTKRDKELEETVQKMFNAIRIWYKKMFTNKHKRLEAAPVADRYREGMHYVELLQNKTIKIDCLNNATIRNAMTCFLIYFLKQRGYLTGDVPPFRWTGKEKIEVLHNLHEKQTEEQNFLEEHRILYAPVPAKTFTSLCQFIIDKGKTGQDLADRITKNIYRNRSHRNNWKVPGFPEEIRIYTTIPD